MTNEELKKEIMYDVEYYFDRLAPDVINEITDKQKRKIATLFFIVGEKLGFKKGMKAKFNITTISNCPIKSEWHDLRKDPMDIPQRKDDVYSIEVWAKDAKGNYGTAVFSYACNHWCGITPIAWIELPTF